MPKPPAAPRRIEYLRLDEIQHAPRNPKRHDLEGIGRSVAHHGVVEIPAVDERTGRLVAGHGRHEQLTAMRDDGQYPPDGVVVDDDGMWRMPVVVGWSSRSDLDAEAYLVASNQLTTKGGWDPSGLVEVLDDLDTADLLGLTGFESEEFRDLYDQLNTPGPGGGGNGSAEDADDTDATPPEDPVSKHGDLWTIGAHRVLCGSALDREDIDRVLDSEEPGIVYTDPPYGIDIVKGNKIGSGGPVGGKGKIGSGKIVESREYKPVIGDETTETARDAFHLLADAFPSALHAWWGGNHYAGDAQLPNASCWLVWDKENGTNGFADCELAWTNHPGAVRIFRHMWNGMLRASERNPRVHPNQKPVALAAWALDLLDPKKERHTVLDVFGGSGSTALGAHVTGRAARIIELDPGYVDVICRRLQEVTGELPFNARLGEPVDLVGRDDA